mgnify:CR=1 FL=1
MIPFRYFIGRKLNFCPILDENLFTARELIGNDRFELEQGIADDLEGDGGAVDADVGLVGVPGIAVVWPQKLIG